MAIIYPPFIGETIPAFVGTTIKIPFTMNPAVGENEVQGFALQIKDYLTFELLATLDIQANLISNLEWYDSNTKSGIIPFSFQSSSSSQLNYFNPTELQYYKFQLGYIHNYPPTGNETIKYSTASIGKYIQEDLPELQIEGEEDNKIKNRRIYEANVDNLNNEENIYSYCFNFYDNNNKLLESSGEIISNNIKYKLKHNNDDQKIKMELIVTTINGYIIKNDDLYTIFPYNEPISPGEEHQNTDAIINTNLGENFIQLSFQNLTLNNYYLIERTIDRINYEEIITFQANDETYILDDNTVEQGIKYYYTIREITNEGIFNTYRKYSDPILIDYEDIYLTGIDGRTLKIKFDPKVSSFKDTIQEQKTETIGSKYPFFFRNGNIKYKEIPISGLISYHMDDNQQFMINSELGFPTTISSAAAGSYNTPVSESIYRNTGLNAANIAAERKFRLAVLEWLNNGEPKLFRSPTEGVYVIRLMNISLQPNDTLGRMLYSFSSIGYEVSDHDIETLLQKKLTEFNIYTPISYCSRLGYFILGSSLLGGVPSNNDEQLGGSI